MKRRTLLHVGYLVEVVGLVGDVKKSCHFVMVCWVDVLVNAVSSQFHLCNVDKQLKRKAEMKYLNENKTNHRCFFCKTMKRFFALKKSKLKYKV